MWSWKAKTPGLPSLGWTYRQHMTPGGSGYTQWWVGHKNIGTLAEDWFNKEKVQ